MTSSFVCAMRSRSSLSHISPLSIVNTQRSQYMWTFMWIIKYRCRLYGSYRVTWRKQRPIWRQRNIETSETWLCSLAHSATRNSRRTFQHLHRSTRNLSTSLVDNSSLLVLWSYGWPPHTHPHSHAQRTSVTPQHNITATLISIHPRSSELHFLGFQRVTTADSLLWIKPPSQLGLP